MSKDPLLPNGNCDSMQTFRQDQNLSTQFDSIDPTTLGGKSILNYYSEQKLIPTFITLSTRYVCLLFESENSKTEYHILQRYTNARLHAGVSETVIKTFSLYDPIDCGVKQNYANGDAHLIMTLTKTGEHQPQKFQVLKIQKDNRVKSFFLNAACAKVDYFQFASVQLDMRYFALSKNHQIPSEEREDGDGSFVSSNTLFVTLINGKLKIISETQVEVYQNPINIFSKATFIGTTGKALVGILRQFLMLVDVESGKNLSQVKINAYDGLELGYYMDIQQYFMIDKNEGKEWIVNFKDDILSIALTEPVIHFDSNEPLSLSYDSVPYQHTTKKMTTVYSSTHNSSFCVAQQAFELTIDDIKFSRSIVLPHLKVCYAIRKSEPYDCIILDLTNVETQFITTVSASKINFGCDIQTNFSSLILSDSNFKSSDVTQGLSTLYKFSQFFKDKLPNIKLEGLGQIKDFTVSGRFLSLQSSNAFRLFDLEEQKEILKVVGIQIIFSDDQQAFILHVGGYNFQYWLWNQKLQTFEISVPFIKNIAGRVDFLPNSHSQVIIYDQYSNSLVLRDFENSKMTTLLKNLSFLPSQYIIISETLIAYHEVKLVDNCKQVVTVLYNIKENYPELEIVDKDQIFEIKLSLDKNYIYIATASRLKVIDAHDLTINICSYSISNVNHIIESKDSTYLICKRDQSTYQILGIATLNPQVKVSTITSGSLIMKYIFNGLQQENNTIKENSVKAYMAFYQFGMVDTHFGHRGETLLHYLIKNNSSTLIKTYFDAQDENPLYQNSFEGISPITYALNNKKLQHMDVILENFNNMPHKFSATSQDLLTLMDTSLPSAKSMIVNLFEQPIFHKSAIPYSMNSNKDIILMPIISKIMAQKMCQKVQSEFEDLDGDEKVVQLSTTKFAYNFERGSQSSLEFLNYYANEESEEVVRSNLRLIIDYKFNECLPFLKIQAGLFFLLLVTLFFSMIYNQQSYLISLILMILNTIFFGYELNQMIRSGVSCYFSSMWNYTDIVGFVFLYIIIFGEIFPGLFQDSLMRDILTQIKNIAIFCLLLRGMSHLRIFSNLRYLINMIVEIIKDMASFAILLVYWILGFNLMFYLFLLDAETKEGISMDSETSLGFFMQQLKLTYKLSFGDFDTDGFSGLQWILFIVSSFFIPLVLFNLIIAIMGDTYGRVQTSARCVDLREQANLVLEVEGLLHWKRQVNEDNKQKLLICFDAELVEDAGDSAQYDDKIKSLQQKMQHIENKIQEVLNMKSEIVEAVSNEIREQFKNNAKQ